MRRPPIPIKGCYRVLWPTDWPDLRVALVQLAATPWRTGLGAMNAIIYRQTGLLASAMATPSAPSRAHAAI